MSLFSLTNQTDHSCVQPSSVRISGEISCFYYSGQIEMTFINQTHTISDFEVKIGQGSNNIGLHDLKVSLDEVPYSISLKPKEEAQKMFNLMRNKDNARPIYGIGNDSYAVLNLPDILRNQVLTISMAFEMPLQMMTKNLIGLQFPLTYPSSTNSEILECKDFQFECQFKLFPLQNNSITSNHDGKLDLERSTYIIDHLEPNKACIALQFSNEQCFDHFATCSGKYGTITFIPEKKVNKDHSEEEFIFIVDCSGSMYGREIKLASQCLIFFLKSLPENCYFNVIRFGTHYVPLFEKPVFYSDEKVEIAINLARDLDADLGGTNLSGPLSYAVSKPLSKENKLRRVYVLTDGCVFDPNEVISLVKCNSNTTMFNSIGIGYGVDRNLVQKIGSCGNGFYDFVFSGDDMRAKVINQLEQSFNGPVQMNVSIEGHELIQFVPPLNMIKFSPNIPATLYFKSDKDFADNTHILIEVEGNAEPIIIEANSFPKESKIHNSLQFLFNSENIKLMMKSSQSEQFKSKIIELSMEYNILTNYTAIIGERKNTEIEMDRLNMIFIPIVFKTLDGKSYNFKIKNDDSIIDVKNMIESKTGIHFNRNLQLVNNWGTLYNGKNVIDYNIKRNSIIQLTKREKKGMSIKVKDISGKELRIYVEPTETIDSIKEAIYEERGIDISTQRLNYAGRQLENGHTLQDYGIQKDSTFNLVLRLCGGDIPPDPLNSIPQRTFVTSANCEDLVSLIIKQKTNGAWEDIPSVIKSVNDEKFITCIDKISKWTNDANFDKDIIPMIVATLTALVFIEKYMEEYYDIWKLSYKKAFNALNSIDSKIDWNSIIKSMINDL